MEGLRRLQRLAHADLVARVHAYHIRVALAQVADVELERGSVDFPDLHPHGLGDVTDGYVVAEQRRAAVPLGDAPGGWGDAAAAAAHL